ncbi:MAG: helix-turn-helix transcriptional regulator [Pirellulales bacterium]
MPTAAKSSKAARKGAARGSGRKRRPLAGRIPVTPARKFGSHLKELVRDAGMAAKDFAAQIGRSDDTVWYWLRGEHVPHIDEWPRIAEALGIGNVRDLVPDMPVRRRRAARSRKAPLDGAKPRGRRQRKR